MVSAQEHVAGFLGMFSRNTMLYHAINLMCYIESRECLSNADDDLLT